MREKDGKRHRQTQRYMKKSEKRERRGRERHDLGERVKSESGWRCFYELNM